VVANIWCPAASHWPRPCCIAGQGKPADQQAWSGALQHCWRPAERAVAAATSHRLVGVRHAVRGSGPLAPCPASYPRPVGYRPSCHSASSDPHTGSPGIVLGDRQSRVDQKLAGAAPQPLAQRPGVWESGLGPGAIRQHRKQLAFRNAVIERHRHLRRGTSGHPGAQQAISGPARSSPDPRPPADCGARAHGRLMPPGVSGATPRRPAPGTNSPQAARGSCRAFSRRSRIGGNRRWSLAAANATASRFEGRDRGRTAAPTNSIVLDSWSREQTDRYEHGFGCNGPHRVRSNAAQGAMQVAFVGGADHEEAHVRGARAAINRPPGRSAGG